MKNQRKKQTSQKLWGWGCLSINCIVISIYLSDSHPELLKGSVLLSVLVFCYGVIKTQMDKLKGDTSIATIAMEYICVFILTFVLGFKTAFHLSSVSVLIALLVVSFVEMLIFLLITYWHAIRRFLRETCQKYRKTN